MHYKNNNKIQTFIQGLRPFSSSIPKTLKKYLIKGSYNYSNIVDNWMKIVPKEISDACYPIKVRMTKEMKDFRDTMETIIGRGVEIYEGDELACVGGMYDLISDQGLEFTKGGWDMMKLKQGESMQIRLSTGEVRVRRNDHIT